MKKYNVGIIGVTGSVGREMVKILEERNFPIKELKLFSSKKSAGQLIPFKKQMITVKELNEQSFNGLDFTLGALSNELSMYYAPYILKAGCIYIDNSSAFRNVDNIPLIIPEINSQDVYKHNGIIANPNCSTIIALIAIYELNKYANINRMIVSTYQAVSGAGIKGMNELVEQINDINNQKDINCNVFKHQIAYNLIPCIGNFDENGYTKEEIKMQNEGRKILNNPNLKVNCTCVRVPVVRSHSESITLEFDNEITVEKAFDLLRKAKGVKLVDDIMNDNYPMPIDCSNQDLVYVGRIRNDISGEENKSLVLWCCGDQLRKGAATNAIQIMELLV